MRDVNGAGYDPSVEDVPTPLDYEEIYDGNNYREVKPNYCLYTLGAMFLGMITYMIIGNHNYGMISA